MEVARAVAVDWGMSTSQPALPLPPAPLGLLQRAWLHLRVAWWGTEGTRGAWGRAVTTGNLVLAEQLWAAGVTARPLTDWQVFQACQHGCKSARLLQAVLACGGNPDSQQRCIDGDTLLHSAVRGPNLNLLRVLLAAGASVDKRNKRGRTPLFDRLTEQETDLRYLRARQAVVLLLEAGADPNAPNAVGSSPLSEMAPTSMVPLILKRGADPLAVCGDGRLAFHAGTDFNADTAVRRWVRACRSAGASLDAPDTRGRTFLFHAVIRAAEGHWDNHGRSLLEHLVGLGASLRVCARPSGDTVLHALIKQQSNANWAPLVEWLLAKDGPWLIAQKNAEGHTVLDCLRTNPPTGLTEETETEWAGVRVRVESVWLDHRLKEGLPPVPEPKGASEGAAENGAPLRRRHRL